MTSNAAQPKQEPQEQALFVGSPEFGAVGRERLFAISSDVKTRLLQKYLLQIKSVQALVSLEDGTIVLEIVTNAVTADVAQEISHYIIRCFDEIKSGDRAITYTKSSEMVHTTVGPIPIAIDRSFEQARLAEEQYEASGSLADLDEAINLWQQVWEHPSFNATSAEFQAMVYNNGSIAANARYFKQGNVDDLLTAVACRRNAVLLTPTDSPEYPTYAASLGASLGNLFIETMNLSYLEEAISIFQRGLALLPPESPTYVEFLSHLGRSWMNRYRHLSERADLDTAIATFQEMLRLTPDSSSALPGYLKELSVALRLRYDKHTGNPNDLQLAYIALQGAGEQTGPNAYSPAEVRQYMVDSLTQMQVDNDHRQ